MPNDRGSRWRTRFGARLQQDGEEESAPEETAAKKKEKPPNAYQLAKERRSQMNKLKTQIRKLEKEMATLEEERQAIHDFFLANPTEYNQEKQRRDEKVRRLLGDVEEKWLELQDELETMQGEE